MRIRSLLFAPGDSARKIEKALGIGADGVILDLEDSVAAAAKDAARAQVGGLLPGLSGRGDLVVRINPRGTPWYLADLAAVVPGRPDAILLPKCTGPDDLAALDHHLEVLEVASGQEVGRIKVLALVTETAASLLAMPRTGDTGMGRVLAFCFGAEDLSSDLGIPPRLPDASYPAAIAHARAAMLRRRGWRRWIRRGRIIGTPWGWRRRPAWRRRMGSRGRWRSIRSRWGRSMRRSRPIRRRWNGQGRCGTGLRPIRRPGCSRWMGR